MRCSECFRRVSDGGICSEHGDSIAPAATRDRIPLPALQGYEILELRGSGGFADVFRARTAQGVEVAIKILRSGGAERFDRELEILAELGAPLAPTLVAHGATNDGRRFIAMEDLALDSLSRRLSNGAVGGPNRAHRAIAALATAVDAMHAAGVIHRDLKPENVFFRPDGTVALIDFGLARWADTPTGPIDASLTRTGERMGTLEYMAPEQWEDTAAVDSAADLYAVGVMAFEMLTGRPPFVGQEAPLRIAHATERCPSAAALAELPAAVDAVMSKALAKEPGRRYATAGALSDAIQDALETLDPAVEAHPEATSVVTPEPTWALVSLRTAAALPRVTALAQTHGALLVRVLRDSYLLAFRGDGTRSMKSSRAIGDAALRQLNASQVTIHAAALRLRRGRRGDSVSGAAVSQWPGWTKDAPGIQFTEVARALVQPESEAREAHSIVELAPIAPESAMLRGRDPLFARLLELARRNGSQRHLATVLGGTGLGKSRLLDELARGLRGADIAVHYARPNAGAGPRELAARMARVALQLPKRTVTLAGLNARLDALSQPLPGASRRALGLLLGLISTADPAVATLLAAPGALRQATARGLCATLVHHAETNRAFALLLDDAHAADHAVLDAIELATMSGASGGFAVIVAAQPSLPSTRNGWGDRAEQFSTHELRALNSGESMALISDLLRPIEFIPSQVIARLAELSAGVPAHIVELARSVRSAGVIRKQESQSGYYVAADELLDVAAGPLAERLGRQTVASLPKSLRPLAEACAALVGPFSEVELEQLQRHLPADEPLARIEALTGLRRLEKRDFLRSMGGSFEVRSPLLREAIEQVTAPDRLRTLHSAALAAVDSCGIETESPSHERIARHAAASGAHERAAAAYIELGESAKRLHRYVDAERHFSAALEHAAAGGKPSATARAGRGQARYRLQRFQDAIADLSLARDHAEAEGDHAEVASLLLEEATALDWCQDIARSATLAQRAAALVAKLDDPALELRSNLAAGRSLYRQEHFDEAVAVLAPIATAAATLGEYETHVISLLVLSLAQMYRNDLDGAAQSLDVAIELASECGDDLHLAAAHTNRQILWMKRHDIENALRELQTCVGLSRKLGNAQLERAVSFNLAELELWRGNHRAAHDLALRSRQLQLGFVTEFAPFDDALLLARIHAAQGQPAARPYINWLEEEVDLTDLPPSTEILLRAVRLATAEAEGVSTLNADWQSLVNDSLAICSQDQQIELLLIAAVASRSAAPWLERASKLAGDSTLWRNRLALMATRNPD